ncbi:ATPase [Helicobacter pylori]|uniref:Dynamin family protein n=1 Tax=Helicobacter pylori TaxID=210 RepID=A0AAE7TR01_HELPX|nr:dynamin family protein [Helicobacter pylori]QQW93844.1 ATPase [Helicobacter pylori]QQX49811.1 dynamin family protein [Helicobacter pylori]
MGIVGIDWFKNLKSSEDLEAHENESHDSELERLKKQHGVIVRVLNAKIENEGLAEYQRILDNEFLAFSNEVEFKEQAVALRTLQELGNELQLVASYPSLFQKSMVAVGGGFSAGKSSFLNHLLGLKLPIGLDKTTAIPTYCLKGEREVLMGRSQNGGVVELPDFSFDHKTLNAFDFDLKSIMPFMILSAPLPFKHLCFIDTPGYNPSNQGYTGGDRQASEEYLANAKYILWVIDCQHGTIQSDDLDYLQELYEEHGKQVFIVLNKADMKTKNDLEKIATNIREILEDKGVEIYGIGTHSSEDHERSKEINENSSIFTPLEGFLRSLDKRSEKQKEILSVLYNVRLAYEKAIKEDLSKFKRYQKELRSLELDLMQKGFDDFGNKIFGRIETLKREFSQKERAKQESLERLEEVMDLFKKSIDKVFDRVSAYTWEKYKEENDDEEDDEENYQEFEEIKKMVLDCRDCALFGLDCYDLNKKQIKEAREEIDSCNELLQLDYSLQNLSRLREFKEKEEEDEDYQEFLNDEEFQNGLREWRDLRNTPEETNRREFEEIKKMVLYFRDRSMYYLECYDLSQEEIQKVRESMDYDNKLLQLDYSLKNLSILKGYKERNNEVYQECLNDSEFQNGLREWRDLRNTPEETNRREFEEIKKMVLFYKEFNMYGIDSWDLSQEEIREHRERIEYHNELLESEFSLGNLLRLKGFKEANERGYQEWLNDSEFQNELRKWRNGEKPGFFESLFNDLFGK